MAPPLLPRASKSKKKTCREFGYYKNSCPNQPVKRGRARRAHDNKSKDELNELGEIQIQSDLDIRETQTRNDADNTLGKSSALETVDHENEDLDAPALSLCPPDAPEQTRHERKVRANTIAL